MPDSMTNTSSKDCPTLDQLLVAVTQQTSEEGRGLGVERQQPSQGGATCRPLRMAPAGTWRKGNVCRTSQAREAAHYLAAAGLRSSAEICSSGCGASDGHLFNSIMQEAFPT